MFDRWGIPADTVSSPATDCFAVVPSDADDLAIVPKGIYVGTGGDVRLIGIGASGGNPALFRNVPSGSLLPVRARRVLATGTTATDLVAMI